MKRRTVLGVLVGAASAVTGGAVLAWPGRLARVPRLAARQPLLALEPWSFEVVAAAVEVVLEGQAADPVEVAHGVDRALSMLTAEAREDFTLMLTAMDHPLLALVLDGRAQRFATAPLPERREALRAWQRSRLKDRRLGYQGLRRLCVRTHYLADAQWPGMGYPGPLPVGEPP